MAKGHKDKVAVITGAANGIGRAFAQRLAEDGVHIAVVDLVDGAETVNLVESSGRQAIAVNCDVSSEQSVANMAARWKDATVQCSAEREQRDCVLPPDYATTSNEHNARPRSNRVLVRLRIGLCLFRGTRD